MRGRRRRSDWATSRRLRGSLMVLGGISLLLILSTIYLFSLLQQSRRNMAESVSENAIWAAFQADRHAANLRAAIDQTLLSDDQADLAKVRRAYDILYSRALTLEEGSFAIKLNATPELADQAIKVSAGVMALAEVVDALPDNAPTLPRAELMTLRNQLEGMMSDTVSLVLASDASVDQAQVVARAEIRRLETALGVNVALLVVGFAGIIGLLAVQMRQIARAGRKLAILSERNRAAAARARAASRAKSTFLATMSHEIRTPLNGIIGASELLARSGLTPGQVGYLAMVRQSGHHLLDVITDILDFSKLESGKVEFEQHRVALPEVADTLTAVVSPRVDPLRVALRVDLPSLEVGIDPARLRQVLVNLTGNAAKFTADGSILVRGWLPAPNLLRVEIIDTGVGIPSKAMPMLFREFSQIDGSASRSYGGSGLGLAISKRIVEGLGGRIGATSEVGQGSTFWFELPIADPRPCAETGTTAQPGQSGRYEGRVLLVEDNAINSAVAEGLLGLLGLRQELARNGAEAVDRVEAEEFDLVLMDVQMPVMSGIEATKEIRRRGHSVRIVGLTGNAFVSDRTDCLRAGMDDFLAKPVTLEKLAQALDRVGLRSGTDTNSGLPEHDSTSVGALPLHPLRDSQAGAGPAMDDMPDPVPPRARADEGIDAELLASLTATLNRNAVLDLLDDLRVEAEALPDALEAARSAGDTALADRHLHSLKGAAATLGLAGAADRVQDLRNAGGSRAFEAQEVRSILQIGIDRAKALVRAEPKAA